MTREQRQGIFKTARDLRLPKDECYRLAQSDNFDESFEYLWQLLRKREREGKLL